MTHKISCGCRKGYNKNCSSEKRKIPWYEECDWQGYLSKGSRVQYIETLIEHDHDNCLSYNCPLMSFDDRCADDDVRVG